MNFLDLAAQYRSIQKEIDAAINSVISRSEFIMGPAVGELEEKVATYCGTQFGVALNSGTDALIIALKALGIGAEDEVIVPSFTYIASAETVAMTGARPVFVDIEPDTFNIDVSTIERVITPRTKAILPVHLYGQPADMDKICQLAKKHNLKVIEDAAQAIGAEYKGKKVGSIGNVGCLSFFPTKNLGAYGDGGMLLTDDPRIAEMAKKWRIHGQSKKYYTDFIGDSSRLDTLQAAVLLVKLKYLDKWTHARQAVANKYDTLLTATPGVTTPTVSPDRSHVYHQYTIRVTHQRDALAAHLKQKGIPTMIYYPIALHQQKAFSSYGYDQSAFPESRQATEEVLSLPIYPELPQDSIGSIAKEIKQFCS